MARPLVPQDLRGLILSASELKAMTNWPDALVEDYLALFDNLVLLSEEINNKNDIVKKVKLVDSSPYEIQDTDEDVFFDTTAGDILATLRPGIDGRNYRLANVGISGNKVILSPFGSELLFAENAPEFIFDLEDFIITYQSNVGWM